MEDDTSTPNTPSRRAQQPSLPLSNTILGRAKPFPRTKKS